MTQILAWKACMHLYFVSRIDMKIQLLISKYWAPWSSTVYCIILIFLPFSLCFPLSSSWPSAWAQGFIHLSLKYCSVLKLKWVINMFKTWGQTSHYYCLSFLSQNLIMMTLECLVFQRNFLVILWKSRHSVL